MGSAIAHTMSSNKQCPVCHKSLALKKEHRNCAMIIKVVYTDGTQIQLHRDPQTMLFHCICDKKREDHSFSARQGIKKHITNAGANWVVCTMVLAMTHS
jgi:hypothetical protein